MPGINQLPAGSEFAAGISFAWAVASWICSWLLLWLTWSHQEKWSYLAFLSMSCIFSNTFSIIQQGRDITWYTDIVTQQFLRKQHLPADDPELAIAGGSFGVDLVLYYLQYYSYNVQAMLVMFWAAELCQLTYQVRENRKIRHIMRKVHSVGISVSWVLPTITILCLQIPALKADFVAFLLIADLPLMLSLAISSSLMLAVTLRYLRSRHKFTHWTPPKFNSANSSQHGPSSQVGTVSQTGTTSQTGARSNRSANKQGLYDRWLLVRFSVAFLLLAIFEITNTLFQVTALHSNMQDAQASAPDLSSSRAIQTSFLYMPGTAPGIFLYIVFGTTAASQQKVGELFSREHGPLGWLWQHCCCGVTTRGRRRNNDSNEQDITTGRRRGGGARTPGGGSGITVERSLTITSTSRIHRAAGHPYGHEDDLISSSASASSNHSDISLDEVPKMSSSSPRQHHPQVTVSPWGVGLADTRMGMPSPSPLTTPTPASGPTMRFFTTATSSPVVDEEQRRVRGKNDSSVIVKLSAMVDEDTVGVPLQHRQRTLEEYHRLGPEHSDDSGPMFPIQKPEVRFHIGGDVVKADATTAGSHRRGGKHTRDQSRNYSRPGK